MNDFFHLWPHFLSLFFSVSFPSLCRISSNPLTPLPHGPYRNPLLGSHITSHCTCKYLKTRVIMERHKKQRSVTRNLKYRSEDAITGRQQHGVVADTSPTLTELFRALSRFSGKSQGVLSPTPSTEAFQPFWVQLPSTFSKGP